MLSGLIQMPWWGYVLTALALTHVTIAAVTIFLHRHQAHRALDLHPVVSHFFRFWLWLTTGMVTKEWAAIHRKHHAKCETEEDPHSPRIVGIRTVLLEGSELYRKESKNRETLEKYGHATPDDWLERKLYTPHSALGIALMLIVNVVLFGAIGITIWAVQMLWIPIFAAGVINGIGHYWGYRSFQVEDDSTNIVPWGILIGGEELHNNHHAYGSSAKLSNKWYEFDIGWMYIRIMEMLSLAKVRKVAPKLRLAKGKTQCDLETLQAVITHRYQVLSGFAQSVKRTCGEELRSLKGRAQLRLNKSALRRWLHADHEVLKAEERAEFSKALGMSRVLNTVYAMRQDLAGIWQRSNLSREQLLAQLNDWCHRAEASGIAALQDFSRRLRCYA